MRNSVAIMLPALSILAPALCNAKPVTDFKLDHYEITGNTVAEFKRSLAKQSPIRSGQNHFGGVTIWTLETTYKTVAMQGGGCEVFDPVVYLKVKVVLPKLVPGPRITPQALKEWNRFIGALRAHELLHAQNGHYTAVTLEKRFTNLKTRVSCARTKEILSEGTSALVKNITQRDRDMDKETNHGETQGAYLNVRADAPQ